MLAKHYKHICFLLSFLLILCFTGCGEETQSPKKPEYVLNYSEDDVLSDEEYSEIEAYIDALRPDFLDVDLVTYDQSPETFDKYMSIGLRGIPVVIDRMKTIENNPVTASSMWYPSSFDGIGAGVYRYAHFLQRGIMGMTREAGYYCAYDDDSHPSAFGAATTRYCFFKYAKERIPEIIKSNDEINEKLKNLSVFGVYALPYVLAQIEQGNTEYEDYFIYIGLHLSNYEYILIADKYYVTIDHIVNYDFDKENLDEQVEELLNSGNSKSFDYKAWLSENEDDLNILFKYVDDFCAEYEAEQNK